MVVIGEARVGFSQEFVVGFGWWLGFQFYNGWWPGGGCCCGFGLVILVVRGCKKKV